MQQGGIAPTLILYQHITDLVFKMLICEHYKQSATNTAHLTRGTSAIEGNALWYAAVYVIEHVLKMISRSNHPLKEDLIDCCKRHKVIRTDPSNYTQGAFEEWTDLLDRGGLCHVKETAFQLFCSLE